MNRGAQKRRLPHEYRTSDQTGPHRRGRPLRREPDPAKDTIMNKLEKLYIKLRDISIQEHAKLNEEKTSTYEKVFAKTMKWRNEKLTEQEQKDTLDEIINLYKEMCEKLVLCEHIDILNKQVQKIDMAKKELVDIILTKVVERIEAKIEASKEHIDGTSTD